MGRWTASIAAGLALLAGSAGCGSDEDEARDVVDAFLVAANNEDGSAICELWSPWAARDALIFFGALRDIPTECESGPTGDYFVPLPPPGPEVTQVAVSEDAVRFEIEGLSGEVEIREFSGEWELNTLCAGNVCTTSTEAPVRAPIGGDDEGPP